MNIQVNKCNTASRYYKQLNSNVEMIIVAESGIVQSHKRKLHIFENFRNNKLLVKLTKY